MQQDHPAAAFSQEGETSSGTKIGKTSSLIGFGQLPMTIVAARRFVLLMAITNRRDFVITLSLYQPIGGATQLAAFVAER